MDVHAIYAQNTDTKMTMGQNVNFSSSKSNGVCMRKEWLKKSQHRACCEKSLTSEGSLSQTGLCE